jgi:hydrogenase nickel incorporation protein HypA/HybF
MHEYGLMESVLERAREVVARGGGRSVSRIRIDVGELAFASRESLETAFASLTAGTAVEGARLEFVEVPARLRCDGCAREGSLPDFGLEDQRDVAPPICAACGSLLTVLRGGGVSLSEVAFIAPDDGAEGV